MKIDIKVALGVHDCEIKCRRLMSNNVAFMLAQYPVQRYKCLWRTFSVSGNKITGSKRFLHCKTLELKAKREGTICCSKLIH